MKQLTFLNLATARAFEHRLWLLNRSHISIVGTTVYWYGG